MVLLLPSLTQIDTDFIYIVLSWPYNKCVFRPSPHRCEKRFVKQFCHVLICMKVIVTFGTNELKFHTVIKDSLSI